MVKKVLVLLIGVAVLVSGFTLAQRHKAEQRVSNIEIAVDMNEFQDLAGELGVGLETLTHQLISSGATSIAVHEATLEGLNNQGRIAYMRLSDLLIGNYSTGVRAPVAEEILRKYADKIDKKEIGKYSIVITQDRELYDFLYNALNKRAKGNIDKVETQNSYAIVIKQRIRNLGIMGMGFLQSDLEYAKSLGFLNIIPRMQSFRGIDKEEIDSKIEQVKKYMVSTVIFGGDTVAGYDQELEDDPEMLRYAAESFRDHNIVTAIIEKPAEVDIERIQRGIKAFSRLSDYMSTKVFSIEIKDAKNRFFEPEDIVEQCSRAIAERNTRIIYARPLLNPYKEPDQNFKDTLDAVSQISDRVKYMGLKLGIVKGLGNIFPSVLERLAIFTGIIAGGLLLLLGFVKIKNYLVYGLLGLGLLGLGGIFALDRLYNVFGSTIGDLTIKAAAFGAAIIFPSLAALYLINTYSRFSRMEEKLGVGDIMVKSILVFAAALAIALVGGIMVASLLAESKYMLKLDIFRGVKLAFITPMLVFVVLYIKRVGFYSDKDNNPLSVSLQLKKLLNTSVTVKYTLVGAAALTALIILLLRSGNAPEGFSLDAERNFRSFLETMFVARPRSKELLAFPILMLMVYFSISRNQVISFFIMLIGTIGLTDIVNTFSHIRMSLEMAVLSSAYSITFGLVAGTVLIVLWNIIEVNYSRYYSTRRETN